ncbi:GAK system CofD-like protein [Pseudodesulfovibrio sp.]|nr:GAK system CofD-like protein [Pseudodesulfovibrio sp.]
MQPENGPRILFFSGGTALRSLSRELIRHTHNSVHIITPFDSGGSSAVLRHAFGMPAVGDIRNRLMALADLKETGSPEMFALFTYRLSRNDPQPVLMDELHRMANGDHVLINMVPEPKRSVIQEHFRGFINSMPGDFDLRGASVGNIVLTAGYLAQECRLGPVIALFSELAQVRGVVCPVVDGDLHLAAELDDGSVVVGQHRLTGKEVAPLSSKISRVWLTDSLDSAVPVRVGIEEDVRQRIASADLICYPIGSFYSSVVANLLPKGVGEAVAANPCPKVFIPNPGGDPELLGHDLEEQVAVLRRVLVESGAPDDAVVLGKILLDSRADYPGGVDKVRLAALGVDVIDRPIVFEESLQFFSPDLLSEVLISLID